MRIAVSASGPSLDAPVDPRFGRAPYFVLVEPETMAHEELENPNVAAPGGAGIQTAQMLTERGVQVVLTGNLGPNAVQTLQAAGMQFVTGVSGTVQSAVQRYKTGQWQPSGQPNVPADFGKTIGGGRGRGMGRGGGRGQGRGMGRGGGRRMGGGLDRQPNWETPDQPLPPQGSAVPPAVPTEQQQESPAMPESVETVPISEVAALRSQITEMQEQIKALQKYLDQAQQEPSSEEQPPSEEQPSPETDNN